MRRDMPILSKEVLVVLKGYDFPGNVRELENIIERGIALSTEGVIEEKHLPDDIRDFQITTYRRKDGSFPTLRGAGSSYINNL